MPVHEKQSQLANDRPKRGLNGRFLGPVQVPGSQSQEPYALGDVHAGGPSTGAAGRTVGRPGGLVVSSPQAATIRVAFTPETGDDKPADYRIYRGSTPIGTSTNGAEQDIAAQPAGAHTVTVRGRDEDGNEFTQSAGANVTVA